MSSPGWVHVQPQSQDYWYSNSKFSHAVDGPLLYPLGNTRILFLIDLGKSPEAIPQLGFPHTKLFVGSILYRTKLFIKVCVL